MLIIWRRAKNRQRNRHPKAVHIAVYLFTFLFLSFGRAADIMFTIFIHTFGEKPFTLRWSSILFNVHCPCPLYPISSIKSNKKERQNTILSELFAWLRFNIYIAFMFGFETSTVRLSSCFIENDSVSAQCSEKIPMLFSSFILKWNPDNRKRAKDVIW